MYIGEIRGYLKQVLRLRCASLRWYERGRTFLVRALGTEIHPEEGTR
jgi:hypothetical protein